MLSKYKLNHMSAGLLDKFIGRNNGYEGYWALGALYTEAHCVELDLLAGTAHPATPACASQARTWAAHLRQALRRHGASPDELAAASIAIEFGLPPVPKRPGYIEYGEPFLCTLRLEASDGRVFARQRMEHCHPHHRFRSNWSMGYTG